MEGSDHTKLFVGGISQETSEDTLRDHFTQFGAVTDSLIGRDRESGNPRGFGFVSFSDSSAVKKALEATHVILERKVDVRKAIPRTDQHNQNKAFNISSRSSNRSMELFRNKKIFVGGLAPTVTEEDFKGYFEQFGRITDVVVMHDNMTNRPRGFGFITFDSDDAVEDVLRKNFHELGGKLVEVKAAVPKDDSYRSNNSYSARVGGGRTYHEHGSYHYYPPNYGVMPGYVPFLGYGGAAGYPYGANFYGGYYPNGPFGGFGYGVTPLAPTHPWNNPTMLGVRGNPWPHGNAATTYPTYLNGRVGVVDRAANGYHSPSGTRLMKGNLSPVGGSDAVEAAEPVQASGEASL